MFTPDNIAGRELAKAITGGKTLNIARRWRRPVWLDRTEAVICSSRKFHGAVSQGTIFMHYTWLGGVGSGFSISLAPAAPARRRAAGVVWNRRSAVGGRSPAARQ